MKRIAVILLTVISALAFTACRSRDYDLYCYEINKLIKNIEFDIGSIDRGKIVLYSDDDQVFNQDYENYREDLKIKYIRKDGSRIFFVLNAALDDDEGIVFVNDGTNSLMDGIYSLERLGGNSYKYRTYK